MSSQPIVLDREPEPIAVALEHVYLASSEGATERLLLDRWLAERGAGGAAGSVIHYDTPRGVPTSAHLVEAIAGDAKLNEAAWLAPVRVIWNAPVPTPAPASMSGLESQPAGAARSNPAGATKRRRDALLMRNPVAPSERAKARLAQGGSGAWQVIEAEPARVADLRVRWQARATAEGDIDPRGFARFAARQAELALERAEYRLRGARYKLPRIYKEDVAGSASFMRGIARLAESLARSADSVRSEALTYLDELRTAHDPFVLDLAAKAFHWMYARGYGQVDLDPAQVEMLRETFARHPVILLPSHKTNLDSPIVEAVLAQQQLPPPTLFAGINMSYWPMGSLMRRAGRVFLRRKISDNTVYRFALREWLSYLIEKRFNLEWFPEGTRSRTGKLLPPKVGLLSYAADAYRQGCVEDLMLVPISIIYDQAQEVSGYAREALGEQKKAENLAWMLRGMRELSKPQGKVYMRIAEPLSMREALGPPDPDVDGDSPDQRLALQKLALAVAWRTNQVTPITGVAVVAFALLAAGQRAVTLDRIWPYTRLLVRQARDRGQPLTQSAEIDTREQVIAILDELIRTGVVARHDKVLEPLYSVSPGHHLAAAFYRNSMLHFVLDRAIGELAVLAAAEAPRESREASFFQAALRLREALKFEFFFRERPTFEQRLAEEVARINPDWLKLLEAEGDPAAIHRSIFPLSIAHAVLRPFLEAYRVVAEVLRREPEGARFEEKTFLDKCQKLGRQWLLEGELRNPESVSRPLFATGIQLIRNIRLADPTPDVAARREQFAQGAREILRRLDVAERAANRPGDPFAGTLPG